MVTLHIGLIVFHKKQHQDFVFIIQSMQDDQYRLIGEYGIHQKVCRYHIVYHDRSFFVNQMKIRLYVQFLMVFATE